MQGPRLEDTAIDPQGGYRIFDNNITAIQNLPPFEQAYQENIPVSYMFHSCPPQLSPRE